MRFEPTGDDEPPPRPLPSYQTAARALGDRFLGLVRPIRVINAVRWDESVGERFLASGGRELPHITRDSYRPLPFDPAAKSRDLLDLEREVARRLGRGDPLGLLLRRRCRQARQAVTLLACRGTAEFASIARKLYGRPTPAEDGRVDALFAALTAGSRPAVAECDKTIEAGAASIALADRLRQWLSSAGRFRVRLSDRLTADAAASGRSIKFRRGARFSETDLALLAVHEGLVHVGTTLNARRQTVCTFLGHCPPGTTAGQEGLAVLCELLAGVSHAGRVRRLWQRYRAVRMADAGADFCDVYRYFLDDTGNPRDAYQQAVRIFRGSLPSAGPFAKDATYARGLVRLLRAARTAPPARLALLFVGKAAPADLPLLAELRDAGLIDEPVVVPSPFDDADKLAARLRSLPHAAHKLRRPYILADGTPAGLTFPLLAASDSLCFEKGGPSRSGGRGVPR